MGDHVVRVRPAGLGRGCVEAGLPRHARAARRDRGRPGAYADAHPVKTPAARTTCDASLANPINVMGPCILRRHHDGPVHQDARGATWWRRPTAPSRASAAFTAFLVLACLTGTVIFLVRGDWAWAAISGIGTGVLAHELIGELAERRRWSRT